MKKFILSLLITCVFASFTAFAQISTAWTSTIKTADLPTGATVPTVAALDQATPARIYFTVKLDGTTYDNVTETTAWTAIGAATKVSIDSNWIEEVWAFNPDADIDGRIVITEVTRRFDNFEPGDLPMQYTAATNQFWVFGYFEWAFRTP